MLRQGLSLLALVLLAGCATTDVIKTAAAPAKPDQCTIEVVAREAAAKRDHEVLCMIEARADQPHEDRSVETALRKAKIEACRCGADAIIVTDFGKSYDASRGLAGDAAKVKASAIRWKAEALR